MSVASNKYLIPVICEVSILIWGTIFNVLLSVSIYKIHNLISGDPRAAVARSRNFPEHLSKSVKPHIRSEIDLISIIEETPSSEVGWAAIVSTSSYEVASVESTGHAQCSIIPSSVPINKWPSSI